MKYKKKFCFEIKTSRGEIFAFSANSEEERVSWFNALTELVASSMKKIAEIFE